MSLVKIQNNFLNLKKDTDCFYAWTSFIAFYCWFNAIPYNFGSSPLKYITLSLNASLSAITLIFFICYGVGCIFAKVFLNDRFPKQFFLVLQTLWTILSLIILTAKSPVMLYALIIIQGFLSGIVFAKTVYTVIFFTINGEWVRKIAITYVFIQIIIYIYLVFPVKEYTMIAYTLGIIFQIFCIYSFYRFKGSVIDVRRQIPPEDLNINAMAIPIILLILALSCISILKNLVIPSFRSNKFIDYYQIVPNALTLLFLYFRGMKMKRIHFLQIALVLMCLTFASFQLFSGSIFGRFVADSLMQPAYLFWDVFMYSIVGDIIYKYGKNYVRARTIFLAIFSTAALTEGLSGIIIKSTGTKPQIYVLFYLLIFALLSMVPYIKKFLEKENMQNTKKETDLSYNVENPEEIPDFAAVPLVTFETILEYLPAGEKLTPRETEILRHLIDKQDTDIIANILGIAKNTVKVHIKNICDKFDVSSRTDLYSLIGLKDIDSELTKRENEVLELVCQDKSTDEIAKELYISNSTARLHIWNICKKLSVPDRNALVEKLKKISEESKFLEKRYLHAVDTTTNKDSRFLA